MKPRPPNIPALYVEGVDDISAIAALLNRHGYDTKQGQQHLYIKAFGSVNELLDTLQDTIKAELATPCGFVLDIDVEINNRWQAVVERLKFTDDPMTKLETSVAVACPAEGYVGKVKGYPHPFGVWLMPDCVSDGKKLEDLIDTLIPSDDPLKDHAKASTEAAAGFVDAANRAGANPPWKRFSEPDHIKAKVRTWLAWQKEPGAAFGAAINDKILGHDSTEAKAFLAWLGRLYNFTFPA